MKNRKQVLILLLLILTAFGYGTAAASVTLSQVPAYNWYHGCGPTAAGSIIGYWDLHGYPNLFTAAGWDNVKLTANVQDQISSPAHNAKYDSTPDAPGTAPPSTSIADWFQTSVDPLAFGWSSLGYSDDAFVGYAAYRGYTFSSSFLSYPSLTWESLTAEIDAGRPLMFLVDTTGDNTTDHFVPVFGYAVGRDGNYYYGFYDTWSEDETIVWKEFRGMLTGREWGVAYATFVVPVSAPVPVPPTVLLLGSGLLGLVGWRRFRKS